MNVTCVISLGSQKTFAILCNQNLIYFSEFTQLEDIVNSLYKTKVSSLKVFVQGTPIPKVPDDAYKIATLNIKPYMTLVMSQKEVLLLLKVANVLGIKDMEFYSYSSFIENKFKDEDVILVSDYHQGYVVIALENGKIIEYRTCSKNNCSRVIASIQKQYKFRADTSYSKIDTLMMREQINNFSAIPKQYLSSIEPIAYCLSTSGVPLVQNQTQEDLDKWKDEPKYEELNSEDDDNPVEGLDELFPSKARTKQGSRAWFNWKNNRKAVSPASKQLDKSLGLSTRTDKIVGIMVPVIMFIFIAIILLTLVLRFSLKNKSKNLENQITLAQARVKTSDSIKENVNHDESNLDVLLRLHESLDGDEVALEYSDSKYYATVRDSSEKQNLEEGGFVLCNETNSKKNIKLEVKLKET